MPRPALPPPPSAPRPHQLPLPLATPPGPAPPPLPDLALLHPAQIWTTLDPPTRRRVRRAVLHILQEGSDADGSH
jgi:hypothetical protein